ncbi:hypothetical protein ACMYYO_02730 [Dermacoccaceae bacterium W4C1]
MVVLLRVTALGADVEMCVPDELSASLQEQWSRCLTGVRELAGDRAEDQPRPAGEAEPDATLDLTVSATPEIQPADPADPSDPGIQASETDPADEQHRIEYSAASQATTAGISFQRGKRLMLHAAGLVDPDTGAAVALVAASGTGKTTASIRLAQSGMAYLTDENVALDEDLFALPYPKPVSVVLDPSDPFHKSQHGPDELGMAVATGPAQVGALVLLQRDPEREDPPSLEPEPPIDAVLALIPQTSSLLTLDRPLSRLSALLERTGGAQVLRYREITDAVPLLKELLSDLDRQAPPVTVLDPPAGRTVEPETLMVPVEAAQQGPWVQAPFTQALADGEDIMVLLGMSPIRLQGLGSTIWRACSQPRTDEELVQLCIAEHGDPGNAAELVASATAALAEYRLLEPVTPAD